MRSLVVAAVVLLALSAAGWWWYQANYGFRHPPGMMAPEQPTQRPVTGKKKWKKGDYLITPLAEFEMTGRVLIAERYWTGRESDLSPVDLTLAWGPASDTDFLKFLDIYKLERYYRYEWDEPGFDGEAMKKNSANMHMIPANSVADGMLKTVKREDIVHLKGYLVQADATDGWSWVSSTTRDDSGNGACEIVWVENLTRR